MAQGATYQREHFSDILPQIKQLVPQHGIDAGIVGLDVDYDKFIAIEVAGNLLCVTARVENKLVGYAIAMASTDLHRRHVIQLSLQDYYVIEEFRKRGVAIRLFKELEKMLTGSKIESMHVDSKLKYDKLFELLGWQKTGHIFSKGVKHV
jgi:GNAT superfamily N-acetyltransferase